MRDPDPQSRWPVSGLGVAGLMQKACDGTSRRRPNTKKCGDLRVYPSNLHYCRPISGRQHESAVGRDAISLEAVGRAGYFGLLQSVKTIVVTGGRAYAPRASFCVLKV